MLFALASSAALIRQTKNQTTVTVVTGDIIHDMMKRELDPMALAGPSVDAVSKLWDTINNDRDSAKIQLQIKNYSKYVLNIIFAKRIHGETDRVPNLIEPGHMEAMLAWGDWTHSPTEGVIGWSYRMSQYCIIYWRVEHDRNVWRVSNRLGMGCYPSQDAAQSIAEGIKKEIEAGHENKIVQGMTWTYTHDEVQTLKHCESDFCLQGSMPSTHQPTVYVSLLPLNVSDWASETGISQDDVTNLNLTKYESNHNAELRKVNHRAWYEPLLYSLAAIGFIAGVIVLAVCCKDGKD